METIAGLSRQSRILPAPSPDKIPIYSRYGKELVDPLRAAKLAQAPNAQVVRRRRDGRIVQINLFSFTDDYKLPSRRGNPQSEIHNQETETNPPRVWEFKHR